MLTVNYIQPKVLVARAIIITHCESTLLYYTSNSLLLKNNLQEVKLYTSVTQEVMHLGMFV